MRKSITLFLFIIAAALLTACGGKEEPAREANDAEPKETEQAPELTDEEAKKIIIEGFRNIELEMEKLQEEHSQVWMQVDWLEPKDAEIYEEGMEITRAALADYIAEPSLDDYVTTYLYAYFNFLDGSGMSSKDIGVRFEVVEQTEDSLKASYLLLADEAEYVTPGKRIVQFIKEEESWKLSDDEFISAEEEPLELTFADLEDYYQLLAENYDMPGELELIDEVENGEETFIVYAMDGFVMARNVSDSSLNEELAAQYRDEAAAETEESEGAEETAANESGAGTAPTERSANISGYDIIIKEERNEWVEASVAYPKLGIENIDQDIAAKMEEQFQEYWAAAKEMESTAKEYGQSYWFTVKIEEIAETDRYVSMQFLHSTYEGGAHGNAFVETFTYDKQSGALWRLEDVLQGDTAKLEKLAALVHDQLMNQEGLFYDVIPEATEARWENFSTFALTEQTLIIFFQPYEVGPYAAGIVEAEIRLDELGLAF